MFIQDYRVVSPVRIRTYTAEFFKTLQQMVQLQLLCFMKTLFYLNSLLLIRKFVILLYQRNIQFENHSRQVATVSVRQKARQKNTLTRFCQNGFARKKLEKGQKARSSRPQHAAQWCVLTKKITMTIFMICLIS